MSKRKGQQTLEFFLKKIKSNNETNPTIEAHAVHNQQLGNSEQNEPHLFYPTPTTASETETAETKESHESEGDSDTLEIEEEGDDEQIPSTSSGTTGSSINSGGAQYSGNVDVGEYINKVTVTDTEKYNILKNAFVPTTNFKFPYSVHCKNKKNIKCFLSLKHFMSFSWLTYSSSLKGLFCKFCVLFEKFGGIHKLTPLGKFVVKPLNKYSKLLGKDGDLVAHDKSKYHMEAVTFGTNFVKTLDNPKEEIRNFINTKRIEQIRDNRNKLKSIIGTVHFLGKRKHKILL